MEKNLTEEALKYIEMLPEEEQKKFAAQNSAADPDAQSPEADLKGLDASDLEFLNEEPFEGYEMFSHQERFFSKVRMIRLLKARLKRSKEKRAEPLKEQPLEPSFDEIENRRISAKRRAERVNLKALKCKKDMEEYAKWKEGREKTTKYEMFMNNEEEE